MLQEDHFIETARLALLKQSVFRRRTAERFPTDPRNLLAADTLAALASDVSVSPENWKALKRYASPSGSWARLFASQEFLEACRGVGFRTAPRTFDRFIETLLANAAVESEVA
jgi:hypothetical protein